MTFKPIIVRALAGLAALAFAQRPHAQVAVDAAVIGDLVLANHILANEGVLDAYGHVSIRHPTNPNRYLMALARARPDHGGRYPRVRSGLQSGDADTGTPVHRALHPQLDLSPAAGRESRGA